MPSELLLLMIERIGLLIGLAFIATRFRTFRFLVVGNSTWGDRLRLGLIFGLFGILGTYTGVVVSPSGLEWGALVAGPISPSDAIANSRAVSVLVAGLVGGPITGLTAGLLAGGHRFFVGGFTAVACALATISQGLISGLLRRRFNHTGSLNLPIWTSFVIAALMEVLQMGLILLIARPFEAALTLVRLISLPMIVANSAGVALFLLVAQSILSHEAALGGDAARKALRIATRALPFLRKGLTVESAQAAATVIWDETGVAAAAITDTEQILAHVGIGADHHKAGVPVLTNITRQALKENRIVVAQVRSQIECSQKGCPLEGVVVVPLQEQFRPVGTLKLYYNPSDARAPVELAEGLAYHFSTQLALARAAEQAALLDKAEIRALQAQIQPHFLFNALNTVMALIRLDPEKARDVVGHLGNFLRRNLHSTQCETVTLHQELEHVQDYLGVEEARYGDRLRVTYDLAPTVLAALIPPLTLQPLVENAIGHGIKAVRRDGLIQLTARQEGECVVITVADNGRGIGPQRLAELLDRPVPSQSGTGLALHNVHHRLRGLYGKEAGLSIESRVGEGTVVTVRLPLLTTSKEDGDDDSNPGGR